MILSATCWKKIRFYMHRMFHRWGRLNSVIVETLNGLRVVKTFAQDRARSAASMPAASTSP